MSLRVEQGRDLVFSRSFGMRCRCTSTEVSAEQWSANNETPIGNGGISYRSWVRQLVTLATSHGLGVTLVTGVPDHDAWNVSDPQAVETWETIRDNFAASPGPPIKIKPGLCLEKIELEFAEVSLSMQHSSHSSPALPTQESCSWTTSSAGRMSTAQASSQPMHKWSTRLPGFAALFPAMWYAKAPSVKWLMTVLHGFLHIPQASAGPGACFACFAGCCGAAAGICACLFLAWNPPAFLTCATANCGATCSAACILVCGSPTP